MERGHGRGLYRGKRVIRIGQWFTSAKGFVSTYLLQKARRGGIWKSYGQARPVSRHRRMRLRRLGQTSNLCIGVFTYDTTDMTHSRHAHAHISRPSFSSSPFWISNLRFLTLCCSSLFCNPVHCLPTFSLNCPTSATPSLSKFH